MKKIPIKITNNQIKNTVHIKIGNPPPEIPNWLYQLGKGIFGFLLLQVLPKPTNNNINNDINKLEDKRGKNEKRH